MFRLFLNQRQGYKRRFLIDSTLGLLEDVTHRPNDSVRSDFLHSWYPRQSNYKTTLRIELRPFPPGEKTPDDQKLKNVKFLDKVKNISEMNYRHDLKHFCCWNHFPNSSASLWNFVFYEFSDGFSRVSKNFIITARRVKLKIMITRGFLTYPLHTSCRPLHQKGRPIGQFRCFNCRCLSIQRSRVGGRLNSTWRQIFSRGGNTRSPTIRIFLGIQLKNNFSDNRPIGRTFWCSSRQEVPPWWKRWWCQIS